MSETEREGEKSGESGAEEPWDRFRVRVLLDSVESQRLLTEIELRTLKQTLRRARALIDGTTPTQHAFNNRRFLGQKRIKAPPGHNLSEWLRFMLPKKTFDRVFSQIIMDYRDEYYEALAHGRKWLAQLRHGQMLIAIVLALILSAGTSVTKRVFDLWKAN